ncbi:TPA: penicillin-binding protein [Candidatus Kaiserbacteria bacterium]|nr:MAG: Penicillin-binding protein, 1A family [Parcubacteria group bacterium GW2011_GWA1_56_13]KKW46999.1 MAG: Penicillin-binding protein, 1A family [Parcubacteria group bacterium GW2011_GWB1_57_6]HCR52465.1 penicillin-binding protein [Candidatus Kaiserbacteria bacterium]
MTVRRRASWRHAFHASVLAFFGFGFLVLGILFVLVAATPVLDISSFAARQLDQSTKIYDRTGQILLYDYNRDAKREIVPLYNISPNIINATIAIEDSSFYEHGGIRFTSIIRAMIADALGGSLSQGGSTITQQVVKNTLLTSRKSIVRKLHEWVLAIKLEQVYSKDQILEAYLNNIPYGGTLYGVEAAAEAYFGKTAKDITSAEASYLAAMIQAPTYYSPYGTHQKELSARKDLVLKRMYTLGFIQDIEYEQARNEKISFAPAGQNSIIAPHFVFYILNQLEEKYGKNMLISGLKVTTTLDADLETKAESIVNQYALQNEKKFRASNASLVALDPATGQILAMVGSRDFFDTAIDGQYNAALASRQPGSTMKPFIYSLALMNGYTRNTVVFDVPTQFSTACRPSDVNNRTSPCYAPLDYDNKFRGPMTFETALAQSINIPAIKVLYLVGIQNAINLAKSFGLTTLGNPNQYGLTLVLGGGEVRLLDLTGAFGVFANDGVLASPTGILQVDDAQGNVLEKYDAHLSRVVPEHIARDMSAMLSDAQARLPEYPLDSPLSFPGYDVAVKTGTTDDTRDAWVIGYTPSVALGVWVGNNDNTPMVKSVAGFIAAPMWHEAMAYALSKYPRSYFGEASPIPVSVPPMLRGNWQIPDANGIIFPHSLLYWTDKNNPQGPPPSNPARDPQFEYWEYGISAWYYLHPELFTNPPLFVPLSSSFSSSEQSSL